VTVPTTREATVVATIGSASIGVGDQVSHGQVMRIRFTQLPPG